MTQAQIYLQKQLAQATADLTIRPLLNESPVLYIDTSEPTPSNSLEQMEDTKIEHDTQKFLLHLTILIVHTQHHLLRKNDMKLRKILSSFPRQSILLSYLQNLHFLQIVMII